ncbi:MAG: 4a-hydroxytetrahydrobiopterin dehydratase [Ornithinimicrobium sp.]|uniref:4a-hydroxytetrahydrobiopterin dehydratase n=1 Tax=Ornithinimicrobium sp. TaxID=1977084 RepID=UPI0026DF9A50|nr:4a-hydroxytetrahydrobiopterin dehydratase [Ornithinimicrobium sp.]MDO5741274.1 4a-hydroxytetrahydrobiopterin dehydratase [Ornithinimicrobium sp.]
MDMLTGEEITGAKLSDWRKLAQGLHARYLVDDFGVGARFVVAVGDAGDAIGHHPRVSIGNGTSTLSWSAPTLSTATTTALNMSLNG